MVRFVRFISALFRFGTGKAKSESSSAAIVVPRSESVQEPRTLNDYVEWFERGRFGTGGGVFSRDEDRRSLGRMMNALTDSGDFRASQIQYAQGLALRVLRDRDARTATVCSRAFGLANCRRSSVNRSSIQSTANTWTTSFCSPRKASVKRSWRHFVSGIFRQVTSVLRRRSLQAFPNATHLHRKRHPGQRFGCVFVL